MHIVCACLEKTEHYSISVDKRLRNYIINIVGREVLHHLPRLKHGFNSKHSKSICENFRDQVKVSTPHMRMMMKPNRKSIILSIVGFSPEYPTYHTR